MSVDIHSSMTIVELSQNLNNKVIYLNGKGALHHCSPSAGGWGISRVACLIPEIEILFVIPMGCGRHGSIAAFSNGTADRITYLLVEEIDLISGDHLRHVEDAIETVINEKNPMGVIVFSTCMDDLLGSDYESIERFLEDKYQIPIRHGKMNPILSESNKAPDVMIQKTIYDFWKPVDNHNKTINKTINILGSFGNIHSSSETMGLLYEHGFHMLHLTQCSSFDEFMNMQYSALNLIISPKAAVAAKHLKKKNHQPFVNAYHGFCASEIAGMYNALQDALSSIKGESVVFNIDECKRNYEIKCDAMREKFHGKSVAVGSTLNARAFELSRFLVEIGFDVKYILTSAVPPFEQEHIRWLADNSPDTMVLPNLNPELAFSDDIDYVDYVFGVDALNVFDAQYLVEIPLDMQLYGYGGAIELMNMIENASIFEGSVADKVYGANLVV